MRPTYMTKDNTWRYEVKTEFDPNRHGVWVTTPHSVFLVMRPV